MTHTMKCSVVGGAILAVALVGGLTYKIASSQHDAAVREIETSVRTIAPAEFVTFKMPSGWSETARFVDPENGNTIYLRNGRMIVVPKNGTKALVDTDPDE
jgi:hypothetical protein